jgi:hypothetical protein
MITARLVVLFIAIERIGPPAPTSSLCCTFGELNKKPLSLFIE